MLLRQEASTGLQVVVGVSLILGLIGVPGLVFLGVARDVVGSESVARGFKVAAQLASVAALGVVGAFVLPSLLAGKPGVGTPTPATPLNGSESSFPEGARGYGVCPQSQMTGQAPHSIVAELEALWYGPGGAGAIVAGCPSTSAAASNGTVWLEGRDPMTGKLLGIGVGGKYPPALLLGAAVPAALSLAQRGELLGASDRMAVSRGDLYLLYTRLGTDVLVRRFATEQRYVLLPSVVAAAWLGAMSEAGRWLWPESPDVEGRAEVYRLRPIDSEGKPVLVNYSVMSDEATRGALVYRAPVVPLKFGHLEALFPSD